MKSIQVAGIQMLVFVNQHAMEALNNSSKAELTQSKNKLVQANLLLSKQNSNILSTLCMNISQVFYIHTHAVSYLVG